MNTNVGDMPLDIFSDYISDILGEDWSWIYLTLVVNDQGYDLKENRFNGYGWAHGYENGFRDNFNYNAFGCGKYVGFATGIGYEYQAVNVREFAKGSGNYIFNKGNGYVHPATRS
jgi:hypothetical protein